MGTGNEAIETLVSTNAKSVAATRPVPAVTDGKCTVQLALFCSETQYCFGTLQTNTDVLRPFVRTRSRGPAPPGLRVLTVANGTTVSA